MTRPSQVLAPFDAFRPPVPHVAVLAGRFRPFRLCHGDPQWCLACLGAFANELAEEMRWNACEAISRPASAYRHELGEDRCSMHSARELRRLTVAACLEHWDALQPGLLLADDELLLVRTPVVITCAFDFYPDDVPYADVRGLRNAVWISALLLLVILIGMVRS